MQQEKKHQRDLNLPDTSFARRLGRMLGGAALLGASGTALAQSITYRPFAASIPTLSGVGLVVLASLMAGAVWHFNRNGRRLPGGRLMGSALVIGAVASVASGVKLIDEAWAVQTHDIPFTNPAGATLNLQTGWNCVYNTTTVTQQIVSIDIPTQGNNGGSPNAVPGGSAVGVANAGCPGFSQSNAGFAPVCTPLPNGTVLQQDDFCWVEVPSGGNG